MTTNPDFGGYDPGRYVLAVLGQEITGFAAGSMIKVARKVPTFSEKSGGGGSVVRIRSRNRIGTFVFTLLATSLSNDYLSGLVVADEKSVAGKGSVGPTELSGLPPNGPTVCHGAVSWVSGFAEVEVTDSDVPGRQWTITCAQLEIVVAGSVF